MKILKNWSEFKNWLETKNPGLFKIVLVVIWRFMVIQLAISIILAAVMMVIGLVIGLFTKI